MFHTIKNYYRPFFFDGLLKAAFILLGILATSFIFATKFPTEAPFGFSLSEKKLLSDFLIVLRGIGLLLYDLQSTSFSQFFLVGQDLCVESHQLCNRLSEQLIPAGCT